jgi:hypothetical protein
VVVEDAGILIGLNNGGRQSELAFACRAHIHQNTKNQGRRRRSPVSPDFTVSLLGCTPDEKFPSSPLPSASFRIFPWSVGFVL